MTLENAQNRLASRSCLRDLAGPKWLAEQAAKAMQERHELYDMLEIAADIPGPDVLLDGLERTLGATPRCWARRQYAKALQYTMWEWSGRED
jgi:hypothetical protein